MKLLPLAALALAAPVLGLSAASAQPARPLPPPQPITITMTDDGFLPRHIALDGGAPYVLRIVNRSGKGHNLTQKSFFRFARIAPADRGWVRDGQISLAPGQRASVRLLAPATRPGGTFQFSSTTLADADSDYKGVFLIR